MMNDKNMQGFTLIETLIAVLLLALSITGPLAIASKGLTATLVAKDQITAFYLAQDALEYVRFARDSNLLGGGDWLNGVGSSGTPFDLSTCVSDNGTSKCYVDSLAQQPGNPTTCGVACPVLRYDTTTKSYNYNGAAAQTPQQFIRTITIMQATAFLDEAVVTITVQWTNVAGVTHAPVVIRENLFRWQ